jgi:hypothetical protein
MGVRHADDHDQPATDAHHHHHRSRRHDFSTAMTFHPLIGIPADIDPKALPHIKQLQQALDDAYTKIDALSAQLNVPPEYPPIPPLEKTP